jgi:hypothetical protein
MILGGKHLISEVVLSHCADVNDGGWLLGGGVEEPRRVGDRGDTDQGVEAVTRRLDRTGAGVTGRPGRGGARGGTGSEEAVAWRSRPRQAVVGLRRGGRPGRRGDGVLA